MVQYLNGITEAAYGTRPGSGQLGMSALSESLKLSYAYEFVRGVPDARIPSGKVKGKRLVRGDISQFVRLDEELFGWFMKSLFGKAPATVAEEASVRWAHTFTHQDNPTATWPSLALDVALMSLSEKRYLGMMVNSLTIDIADGGPATFTWGMIGRPPTNAAFGAAVAVGSEDFLNMSLLTTVELGDVAISPGLRSLSLNISNNLDENAFEDGSRDLVRGEMGELDINGTLTKRYTNATQFDDLLAETERKLELDFTGGTLGNASYALDITIGAIVMDESDPNFSNQDDVKQSIPFVAVKPSSGNHIDFVLKNNVASYA